MLRVQQRGMVTVSCLTPRPPPLRPQVMSKAPMYFKQALEHAESEWAQHAAKAVIDTKAKVRITRSA